VTKKKSVTIADQLKQEIRSSGLTHYSLGQLAGIAPSQLDRFMLPESDPRRRDLRLESAGRIATALGLVLRPE
jgi:hypothetical protein